MDEALVGLSSSSDDEVDNNDPNPDDEEDSVPIRRSRRLAERKETQSKDLAAAVTLTPKRGSKKAVKESQKKASSSATKSTSGRETIGKQKERKDGSAKPTKKKSLKKGDREAIMKKIADVTLNEFEQQIKMQLSKESEYCHEVMQKEIINNLVKSKDLFPLLVDHHRTTFISLYEKNSTGKKKYLRFRIEWHKQCSVFLIPKEISIDTILPDPLPIYKVIALQKNGYLFVKNTILRCVRR